MHLVKPKGCMYFTLLLHNYVQVVAHEGIVAPLWDALNGLYPINKPLIDYRARIVLLH